MSSKMAIGDGTDDTCTSDVEGGGEDQLTGSSSAADQPGNMSGGEILVQEDDEQPAPEAEAGEAGEDEDNGKDSFVAPPLFGSDPTGMVQAQTLPGGAVAGDDGGNHKTGNDINAEAVDTQDVSSTNYTDQLHADDVPQGLPSPTTTQSPPSEPEYTTALATDTKVVDALKSLDGMWTTADPSGHTSIATNPEVVGALKELDDMWKKQPPPQDNTIKSSNSSANNGPTSKKEVLRETIWTKPASGTTGESSEDEDEDNPLVGGKAPVKVEPASIGLNAGASFLNIALADTVDNNNQPLSQERKPKGRRRYQSQQQQQKNPLSSLLGGLGRKPEGRLSPTDMADEGGILLESDAPLGADTSESRYTDAREGESNTNGDDSNAEVKSSRNKGGIFGLGIIQRNSSGGRSGSNDDEGASAPLSRKPEHINDKEKSSSSDSSSSEDEADSDKISGRGNNGEDAEEAKRADLKIQGIGSDDDLSPQKLRARRFFRKIDERERQEGAYTLEKMTVAKDGEEEARQKTWQSKFGKIALGILVPEVYADDAIEEIEGDTSNTRRGRYGRLSMDNDDDTDDEREAKSLGEDDKALEDTLRDQIRMLGGRVMELESELMEKTDEVSTLQARVQALEAKLGEREAADKANASNLIDLEA